MISSSKNGFYNLRSCAIVKRRNIRTRKFDFETVSIIGAFLWIDLPAELKNTESLKTWKINPWSPRDCPCKICRKFIKNLGYMQHQPPSPTTTTTTTTTPLLLLYLSKILTECKNVKSVQRLFFWRWHTYIYYVILWP